jgi:uridine phosphorylase
MPDEHLYFHEPFNPQQLAQKVLTVGDPARAADAAELLEGAEEIWNSREYRAFSGRYRDVPVSVCSHGVGSTGASYMFELLFSGGVNTIIRAGTCGAMIPGVPAGALMIATGAIRNDGASEHVLPMQYPAVADWRIVTALKRAGEEFGWEQLHTGLILTNAMFFPYPGRPSPMDIWCQGGAIAVEMELAPLLVLAGYHGAAAGGIFTADGNVTDNPDVWEYEPHEKVVKEGKRAMLKIALDALVSPEF